MPTPTTEILADLAELLRPERFEDYGPNGLQVPGPAEVQTIATGVSASAELFELAARERADLLIVHHGLFWGKSMGPIDPQLKHRLQLLFNANIALAAYHLPLDAHPTLGNNALLAAALGAQHSEEEPFALHNGEPIGCLARFPAAGDAKGTPAPETEGAPSHDTESIPAHAAERAPSHEAESIPAPAEGIPTHELIERVRTATGGREPLVFETGPSRIRTLAIVSGGGSDYLSEAAAAGAEAFLTGEPTERVMAQARELEVHYIAAGHYATETFGVRALGEHLAERHELRHVFLDVPNPV
jgi:dinuclear metal center YbgI/SA1388 family protein